MEESMDLGELLQVILKRKWIIILCLIVSICIGGIYGFFIVEPVYQADTTLMVNSSKGLNAADIADSFDLGSINFNQKIVITYVEIVKSRVVLEQVIDKLKIDESYEMLLSKITSNPVGTTEILKISVKDQNPEQAALIANTITDVFIKEVIRILKVNNVEVIDKAIAIHNPINSKQEVYLAISAILGIMTGTLIAFILESLDNTLKSQEDVEKYLGLPVIGATLDITKILEKNATGSNLKNLIVHNLPKSPVSESYRSIRTNIQFANVDRGIKTIMFTSSTEKEGKTTTISNVAMTFADAGYKVVIVDCDLRKSEIHRFFGISNAIGITDELLSGDDYKKYIHKDDDTKLHIIPAGKMPANPSEILCSDVMKALVMKLKRDYDYIFIDAPPILPVTDATVMSSFIDAVVFVCASGEVAINHVKRAKESLEKVNANIIGIVLTKVSVKQCKYHNNYYYRNDDDNEEGEAL